ncbi:MAG: hypothetical protein AAGE98_04425 [Actinomycetota bacterium]
MPAFNNPFRRSGSDEAGDDVADEVEDGEEDLVDDDDSEWLAYELHEWASQSRAMLAQLLIADQVPHSWQGTTLLAHETVEAAVDTLIEEVEAAENPELDPDKEQVAFEMEGWSGELQALLVERLGGAAVPHAFDGDGDLVVHEEDEEQVEMVIDDLLARAAEEGMEELDGLDVNDLLSSMFTAADRLRRDVHDGPAVLAAVEHGRRIAGVATPFGFGAPQWSNLRERCLELIELLEADDSEDDDIVDLAHRLRDSLQRVI